MVNESPKSSKKELSKKKADSKTKIAKTKEIKKPLKKSPRTGKEKVEEKVSATVIESSEKIIEPSEEVKITEEKSERRSENKSEEIPAMPKPLTAEDFEKNSKTCLCDWFKKLWKGSSQEKELTPEEKKKAFREDCKFIAAFIVIFSLFRFFVYDWYIVPSSSMVPTLLIGDMPFVEKFAYGFSKHNIWFSPNLFSGRIFFRNNVKRGDVIVFKYPEYNDDPTNCGMEFVKSCLSRIWDIVTFSGKEHYTTDINLVKRVIAIPGDRVRVENGVVYVNDQSAQLTPKGKMVYRDIQHGDYYNLSLYEEKLPCSDAPVHTVAYIDEAKGSQANNFSEITVPEGHYFVMGDDRDLSKDSRCGLGLVPEENLMGRAIFRVWSIDNGVKLYEPWLWLQNIRYDRLFRKII